MLCSNCKKNLAVVFVTKIENGKQSSEGMCLTCAKELNLAPIDEIMKSIGIEPEEFEELGRGIIEGISIDMEDMDEFENALAEMGGAEMLGKITDVDADETETDADTDTEPSDTTIPHIPQMGGDDINPFEALRNFASKFAPMGIGGGFPMDDKNSEHVKATATKVKPKQRKPKNLDKFGTNLTAKARNGELDTVVGRDTEIQRMMQILNRRTKNNPCLVGEPGVGKTAIAEGLAVRICEHKVPPKLLNKEIYQLDLTSVVAGTQFRGQFEARMKSIIDEAREFKNIILVIDEIHSIVGAGDADGAMSAANILKPALAKGEIQIIGATTLDEYRKYIEKDSALERRFQPIMVEEPTEEETIDIIKGLRPYYEKHHHIKISDQVIALAVKLSKRYISDRFLPDKAIDVIDEAGSRINLTNTKLWELAKLKNELNNIQKDKENAAAADSISDYKKAADLKSKECYLEEKINNLENQCENIVINPHDIAEIIEMWTKIPVKRITDYESNQLMSLDARLAKKVIGQDDAIKTVSNAIRVNRAALSPRHRPVSFIFVGPTGVGKTELVRQLATELFGSEDALIRLDMSEYMEKHAVSKIIGSPPGYVGYDDAGQLTEKVRRHPYCVILLDEIEKAHHDIFNVLLQVLDEGRITDSKGRAVSFENAVIIMTSNAGSTSKEGAYGFNKTSQSSIDTKVNAALKELFRPEFLNRVDEVIPFKQLEKPQLLDIAKLLLSELEEGLKEKSINVEWSDSLCDFIVEKGYDIKYGARPMRRIIKKHVETKLSHMLITNELKDGDSIYVDYVDDDIVVNKKDN
ncbi:MAG: AAA family ATPase [Clostridiales bacterium]|jgi:ATP-dependent Clp protease ATP-binding subunit ClpE|nr:AAA family ATPase [Clostridiales bacterium]